MVIFPEFRLVISSKIPPKDSLDTNSTICSGFPLKTSYDFSNFCGISSKIALNNPSAIPFEFVLQVCGRIVEGIIGAFCQNLPDEFQ